MVIRILIHHLSLAGSPLGRWLKPHGKTGRKTWSWWKSESIHWYPRVDTDKNVENQWFPVRNMVDINGGFSYALPAWSCSISMTWLMTLYDNQCQLSMTLWQWSTHFHKDWHLYHQFRYCLWNMFQTNEGVLSSDAECLFPSLWMLNTCKAKIKQKNMQNTDAALTLTIGV